MFEEAASVSPNSHEGPVVRVTLAGDGQPLRAAARGRIDHPAAHVWATIYDVERFANYLPMVNHARRRGDSVTFDLKFRIGFFSVGFEFTTLATYEPEKWLLLTWTAGEPRGIKMRFSLTPIVREKGEAACLVETEAEFEVQSLGWLVKYFLKHHPEIQHGIFPGITLVLLDSIRRATAA
jgi:ribosome-associated toxin RatA of RatAB toxin-antitoxin module